MEVSAKPNCFFFAICLIKKKGRVKDVNCAFGLLPVTQRYATFCEEREGQKWVVVTRVRHQPTSVTGVAFMNFCTLVGRCNHSYGQTHGEQGHLLGAYVAGVRIVL